MAAARLAYVNLFARDIVAQAAFYTALFGFTEIQAHRSPIYRCLDANGTELGFNAPEAYDLLALQSRRPPDDQPLPLGSYFTIELDSEAAIDRAVAGCRRLGGSVLKEPYLTYYNAWQAVLADPEGNVFRVNHRIGHRTPYDELPDGRRSV
ncbi:VOC family protein [Ferrovibrio sp.]|uniref:VOC family protein n=1 Tax=Ferrovibrio sp. TaxID=1917215 RepID=UPI00260EE838|nr:VOC family protein [Ferrovibrio sp.]